MSLSFNTETHHHHVAILASAVAIAALFIRYLYVTLLNPYWRMPGPWITRFTSWAKTYHDIRGEGPRWVQSLHEKYGPVVRITPDDVDVADVGAAREIHAVAHGFRKAPWYQRIGGGVINVFSTTDTNFHRQQRRLLSAPMADSNLRTLEPQIRAKAELWAQQIEKENHERGAADVFKWNMFYTTDVIAELTFGESFHMLEKGKKNQYILDLESAGKGLAISTNFPNLFRVALWLKLPVPLLKQAVGSTHRMKAYAAERVARYRTLVSEDPEGTPPTLFRKLFALAGDNNEKQGANPLGEKQTLSDAEISNEGRGYIIAGSDTTSITLTYLIWTVCRRPDIRSKLLEELRGLPEGWNDQHLRDLPYLGRVITETLRLYSAAPFALPRVVPPGGAELAGWHFPEGGIVCTQAYSMHRIPGVFQRAGEFDPDRWEDPTRAMKDGLMPFGGGARICLGMNLAKMELRLATALFFTRFPDSQPSTLEGMCEDDMKQRQYFLMAPDGKRCLMELK